MKKLKLALVAMFALALSFALVGCGGGGDNGGSNGGTSAPDYTDTYVGTWKLVALEDENGPVPEEDIAFLEEIGLYFALELNEDGSANFNMAGELMAGTWEAESSTVCILDFEGEPIEATLANDVLTMTEGTESLSFGKLTEAEAAELKSIFEAMAGTYDEDNVVTDESFTAVEVANDETATIVFTERMTDEWGDSGYLATVTNNLDKAVYVTAGIDPFNVNGQEFEFWGGNTLYAGETMEIFFYAEADDVASLDQLVNVSGTIEVWDDATLDTIVAYPFTIA